MNVTGVEFGQVVPSTTAPGFVALSYIVSVVGCMTALELLHRRHYHSGPYNWVLLVGAATAMGGVAIWAMHFIGMCAVVMANNEEHLQIIYYPAYTVGSLILAIGVVGMAFLILSSSDNISPVKVVVGGIICGSAICGMHYVGQVGIINYWNLWSPWYILGSAIIAVVAATVALGIFFWQKSTWTNALWKRLLCAFGLAGAVSLMHWVSILGTSYAWRGNPDSIGGMSKDVSVWVCCALALFCCGVLLAFAVLWQYVSMLYAQKAKQVSLGLAYWDHEGRIMLNSSGLLPSSKITSSYAQHSFKDQFDVDHPIFSWLFRVSRNWSSVWDIVPHMRQHIRIGHSGSRSYSLDGISGDEPMNPATLFKELFCVTAHDLACSVEVPLMEVGSLYDKILDTGSIALQPRFWSQSAGTLNSFGTDRTDATARRPVTLGRGQLLFLVHRLNKHESMRMQSMGFSFAPVNSVCGPLAHSLQITSEELKPFLDDMSVYSDMPRGMSAGVYLACFALKPKIGDFEVLVRKDLRNLLPSVKMPLENLERWQTALLSQYDDWEVNSLLKHWEYKDTLSRYPEDQREFVTQLSRAMREMLRRVGDKLFWRARLVAQPLEAPCRVQKSQTTTVIAFRFMTDIHYVHPATYQDCFVSTRLFLAQQHCYPGSSDHHVFASHVRQEFSFVSAAGGTASDEQSTQRHYEDRQNPLHRASVFLKSKSPTVPRPDASMVRNKSFASTIAGTGGGVGGGNALSDTASEKHDLVSHAADGPSSGVYVNNEIRITITDAKSTRSNQSSPTIGSNVELDDLHHHAQGPRTEIEAGKLVERDSMMDVLMGITLGRVAAHAI